MDPRLREDDAGKATVIPSFDRHSCVEPALDLIGGRNPSLSFISVTIFGEQSHGKSRRTAGGGHFLAGAV